MGLLISAKEICPADITIMNRSKIRMVTKVFDFEKERSTLFAAMPNTMFSLGASARTLTTKTNLTHHLRNINAFSRTCRTIISVFRAPLFESISSTDYVPRWLKRLADTSTNFYGHDGSEFVLVRWGIIDPPIEAQIIELQSISKVTQIECYISEDWKPVNVWNRKSQEPTFFSKKWLTEYEQSGALMKIAAVSSEIG